MNTLSHGNDISLSCPQVSEDLYLSVTATPGTLLLRNLMSNVELGCIEVYLFSATTVG